MFLEKSYHRSELPMLVLLAGQSTPVTQVVKSSETLSLEKHGDRPCAETAHEERILVPLKPSSETVDFDMERDLSPVMSTYYRKAMHT